LAGNESFHLHEYPLISDTELTFEAHAVFTKKVRLLGVFTQPRPKAAPSDNNLVLPIGKLCSAAYTLF